MILKVFTNFPEIKNRHLYNTYSDSKDSFIKRIAKVVFGILLFAMKIIRSRDITKKPQVYWSFVNEKSANYSLITLIVFNCWFDSTLTTYTPFGNSDMSIFTSLSLIL